MPQAIATVVIVNYNGAHLLPACLDALDAQRSEAAPFETVVVDNNSSDDSRDLLAAKYPWVRVIESASNLGFAGGNNLAAREVMTPFTVMLNNDAMPQARWLERLLAPFSEPGADRLAAVNGKTYFHPRFLRVDLTTTAYRPGPHDGRDLGVKVSSVTVDDTDVTRDVRWESAAYGPETVGQRTIRWTRPTGEILVPVPDDAVAGTTTNRPVRVELSVSAERTKPLTANGLRATVGTEQTTVAVELPCRTTVERVINNVGSIVLHDGHGADRGFEERDTGQFDEPVEIFAACGNGMAIRTEVGSELGWFDDDYFMYYEDIDLSWRIRSRGYSIRYEPTAELRHLHSASSDSWSPNWTFHVDRNRLLTLTKDASTPVACSAVLRYPLVSLSMLARSVFEALRTRSRPAAGRHVVRAKVLRSYFRLLPRMIRRRRNIAKAATVTRAQLETWLTVRA